MGEFNVCCYNDWIFEDEMRGKHYRCISRIESYRIDLVALDDFHDADRKKLIQNLFKTGLYGFIWMPTHFSATREEYRLNGFAILKNSIWDIHSLKYYWVVRTESGFQLKEEASSDAGLSVIHARLQTPSGEKRNVFVTNCGGIVTAMRCVEDFSSKMEDVVICDP